MSGTGGFLRKAVQVRPNGDEWQLRYSIWEINIPARQVEEDPHLFEFLERRRSVQELQLRSDGSASLVQLLLSQGCITYDATRESYSLDETRFLIGALASDWYGQYYAHPFWDDLRHCRLSLQQIFGWALRTYHLSRSAGPTAARGAIHSPKPHIRAAFLKSALEEYAHCEAYYFPKHPAFGLDSEWIKTLLPMPSSTAFDQHMSVMAEEDWLAHAISGYFQEYTAAFRENAFALYERIEKAYGLAGFFKGWKDHIGYDIDQTHADEFAHLFAGQDRVAREDFLRSIGRAAMTVEYLIGGLDELAALDRHTVLDAFRVPPALIGRGTTHTTVFGGADVLPGILACPNSASLADALVNMVRDRPEVLKRTVAELHSAVTRPFLVGPTTRALSVAYQHDDIVLLGGVVEMLDVINIPASWWGTGEPISAGSQAICNFVREAAREPTEFLFLLGLCDQLCGDSLDVSQQRLFGSGLRDAWSQRFARPFSIEESTRLATLGLRFLEISDAAARLWRRIRPQDLLA